VEILGMVIPSENSWDSLILRGNSWDSVIPSRNSWDSVTK